MRPFARILASCLLLALWCLAPAHAGFKPGGAESPGVLPSVAPIQPIVPQPPAFSPAPPDAFQVPGRTAPRSMTAPAPVAPSPGVSSSPGASPSASPASAHAAAPRAAPLPTAPPPPPPPPKPTASSPWVPILVVVVLFFVWLLPTRDLFGKPPPQREERPEEISLEIPTMRPIGKPPRKKGPT